MLTSRRVFLFSLPFLAMLFCHPFRWGEPLAAEAPLPRAPFPLGERWFTLLMGDRRIGFIRTMVEAAPGGYRITTDSSAMMVVLGFSRNAASQETYLVNRDLSLRSCRIDQVLDGKRSTVAGEVTGEGMKVTVESAENLRKKSLTWRQSIYPAPVLNAYPLVHGLSPGRKATLRVFDPEQAKLKKVTVEAVARESMPGVGQVLHLRNDLYSFVDNDIWVDHDGNTLRESVRNGLVLTTAEDPDAGRLHLLADVIANREVAQHFRVVPADLPIERPMALRQLTVTLSGIPLLLQPVEGVRQTMIRQENGDVAITTVDWPAPVSSGAAGGQSMAPDAADRVEPGALALALGIVGKTDDPSAIVAKLARWIAAEVVADPEVRLPPLETAKARKGDVQSRVGLFSLLARSLGIRTREATGLTYARDIGFVYHRWVECCLGAWVPVDPAWGQFPADPTHLKLVEGENPLGMAVLGGTVGRLTARVTEQAY